LSCPTAETATHQAIKFDSIPTLQDRERSGPVIVSYTITADVTPAVLQVGPSGVRPPEIISLFLEFQAVGIRQSGSQRDA
jgi:hypothetical protein